MNNKRFIFASILFEMLFLAGSAIAQESTSSPLFKTIDNKLDTVIENQVSIEGKLENDSLKDRRYGVEINLFYLLSIGTGEFVFSGGYSRFYPEKGVELSFPVYHLSSKENGHRYHESTFDLHYRYFLGETTKGFYLSAMTRTVYLSGRIYDDQTLKAGKKDNELKWGMGFGIGYRIFSKKHIYWGASLSVGRYLVGEHDKFAGYPEQDSEGIFDIELLKFGYAF